MAAAAAAGKGRGGSGMSLASELALDKKKTKIGMKMAADVARAFKEIDADGSGTLDIKEVGNVVEKLMGQAMDPDKLEEVLHKLDKDGNGEVSRQEFEDWWLSGDESDIAGLKMSNIKTIYAMPAEMLYHMFEGPEWFLSMGLKGRPFYIGGELICWTINVLILISTFAFCFETMARYSSDKHLNPSDWEFFNTMWRAIEYICVFVFTIDFGVRMVCGILIGQWIKFKGDPMNAIDVLAILPFYIALFLDTIKSDFQMLDLRFLRVIRLARILRSLPEKYAGLGGVVVDIVVVAGPALFLPLFFMSLAMVCLASLEVLVEGTHHMVCKITDADGSETGEVIDPWDSRLSRNVGLEATFDIPSCVPLSEGTLNFDPAKHPDVYQSSNYAGEYYGCPCPGTIYHVAIDGEESTSDNFSSMGSSMWWTVVTFTTVGYGDFNPQRAIGQLIAMITMFTGIFFLAMPLAIVGSSFVMAWEKAEQKQLDRDAAAKIAFDVANGDAGTEANPLKRKKQSALSTTDQEQLDTMTHETIGKIDLNAQFYRTCEVVDSVLRRSHGTRLLRLKAQMAEFNDEIRTIQQAIDEIETHKTKADQREAEELARQEAEYLAELEKEAAAVKAGKEAYRKKALKEEQPAPAAALAPASEPESVDADDSTENPLAS